MLVHWCMCMAACPFFGTAADAAGRLLRLQGTAAAAQIQHRLRERLGERETVARAARRVLMASIDAVLGVRDVRPVRIPLRDLSRGRCQRHLILSPVERQLAIRSLPEPTFRS